MRQGCWRTGGGSDWGMGVLGSPPPPQNTPAPEYTEYLLFRRGERERKFVILLRIRRYQVGSDIALNKDYWFIITSITHMFMCYILSFPSELLLCNWYSESHCITIYD